MRKIVIAIAALSAAIVGSAAASEREHRRDHDRHHDRDRDRDRDRSPRGDAQDAEARALYRKECGACHLDFPPGLLPAESHRRILAGLERHFGENAELEPELRARLERWLVSEAAEAGTHRKSRKMLASMEGRAPLRITEVPYFRRKHREIDPGVAARPGVRSLANCGACHPGAKDWDFDDDRVKIPRG